MTIYSTVLSEGHYSRGLNHWELEEAELFMCFGVYKIREFCYLYNLSKL